MSNCQLCGKLEDERNTQTQGGYTLCVGCDGLYSDEELKERWWDQINNIILKQDMAVHIDSNQTWIDNNLKLAYQKEKVDFLEAIIKSLNNRGFNINAAVSWEKFKVGI